VVSRSLLSRSAIDLPRSELPQARVLSNLAGSQVGIASTPFSKVLTECAVHQMPIMVAGELSVAESFRAHDVEIEIRPKAFVKAQRIVAE
jgi:hypothetical protein